MTNILFINLFFLKNFHKKIFIYIINIKIKSLLIQLKGMTLNFTLYNEKHENISNPNHRTLDETLEILLIF